jgi:hypothetical protein
MSETARKNHDELFPGHVSTLAVTDPELIEVFDNFAFDEVLGYGNHDTRIRWCYPYLSWIIHKPHSTAVKRISHLKDELRNQTCDFCAPTSFGLFVCLLTKRRFMPF